MAVADVLLSPWNNYRANAPIVDVGTGYTLKVKLCEDYEGDPDPIDPALDITLVEGPAGFTDVYTGEFDTDDLLAAFEDRIGDVIAVHYYNDSGYHTQERVLIVGSRLP